MIKQPSYSFVPPTCTKATSIGVNCSISNAQCDVLNSCQNNGTCYNSDANYLSYACSCPSGFNGTQCQFDHRPCQPKTCRNNGICNDTSDTTFVCLSVLGWEGIHCELQINYCMNVICMNNGVCRPLFMNFTCECLGDSYSGRHCEIIATKINISTAVSKSFASVAIIAMISVAMFVIIMDVLKYYFGIDPVRAERERMRREKQQKKARHHLIAFRFIYANAPSSQNPISSIEETTV